MLDFDPELRRAYDALHTLRSAIKYQYSNGPLGGTNNKIKVLKHTAYGFGNFNNFRLWIHLMFELKKGA
ncbi:hypothetical protein EQK45_03675 [Lactiplantibacillus plantarum]|uniref:transposase n=1 Tax=Lactiplantibacillus plantarum TaxID=1590 RepID=UPI000A17AD71|nr:transposase [Lactiplantibacillus plantarum]ARK33595.1 hypothetical protein B5726_03680 [Lactiplantibacillus plantarum]QAS29166.1 hypothetical protein EQK45_03675 [Lactiplantibacillus plantarum]RWZ47343.1 hypothetical protein EQJ06_03670 [Lactiplantibacillus plantarum]